MYHVASPSYKVLTPPRPKRKIATFGTPLSLNSTPKFRFLSSRRRRTFIEFYTVYSCFHEFSSFSQLFLLFWDKALFLLFWNKATLLVILQTTVIVRQFPDSRLQRLHSIFVQSILKKTLRCSPLQQIQLLKTPAVYISQSML